MMGKLMTCGSVDELLLDILEGDVSAETSAAVEAHVSGCARCTALLRDIGHVRESAAALPDLAPSSDLWKGISARIETPVVSLGELKQNRYTSPLWIAAAASLLVVASSGVTYWATSRSVEPERPAQQIASLPAAIVEKPDEAPAEAPVGGTISPAPVQRNESVGNIRRAPQTGTARFVSGRSSVSAPEAVFDSEIARLQRVIAERKNELDPQTVSVVEMNLKLIDAAIKSSRAALAKDPGSGFLSQQLTRTLDKKVELLRTVALMPSST